MQATFKPTGYRFTFHDIYFVRVQYAGAMEKSHDFIACFKSLDDAADMARAYVKRSNIVRAWVFTRDEQVFAISGEECA